MRLCRGKDNPLPLPEAPTQSKFGFDGLCGEPCRNQACERFIKRFLTGDSRSLDHSGSRVLGDIVAKARAADCRKRAMRKFGQIQFIAGQISESGLT